MNAERHLARLRRFLLYLAAFICAGTIIELWLTEHYTEAPQFIPFAMCALGLLMLGWVLARPGRRALLTLRGVMALVAGSSLLGVVLHLVNNFQFELEIRPNAAPTDVIMEALRGANPLLAPGVLLLAALLAWAATVDHPALNNP
ncbi:MAG: hypothetical protein JNJ61_11685 [Anaerolineae bacterium]|nr:hypothetical protein [Anaerolineae bacterium]